MLLHNLMLEKNRPTGSAKKRGMALKSFLVGGPASVTDQCNGAQDHPPDIVITCISRYLGTVEIRATINHM